MDRELETLLGNTLFVRAVARGLLRDEDAVDDVLQQAWLAALRRPPKRPRSSWRTWVRRVITNLSLNRRRTDRRRATHEQAVPAAAQVPSPEEILHREVIRQSVVECVLELGEAYRTAVLLRYFDGRSLNEIASAVGVPEETVKTRLRRARHLLRDRLTEKHGSESHWLPALVQLAGEFAPIVGGTAIGVLLGKFGWVTAAAVLILASLTAVWQWQGRTPKSSVQLDTLAVTARDAATSSPDRRTTEAREELRARDATTPAALVATSSETTALEGRFTDAAGTPLPGVHLSAENERSIAVVSDPGGRFRWTVPPPVKDDARRHQRDCTVKLVASKPGFVARKIESVVTLGTTVVLGTLELELAGTVIGRVLDADGHPQSGATVLAGDVVESALVDDTTSVEAPPVEWLGRARSDDDGRFQIDDVRPGWVHVWANAPEHLYTSAPPVELRAGDTAEVTIALSRIGVDRIIAGVVLGPDGKGVANAQVLVGRGADHEDITADVMADEQGRFRCVLRHRVSHWVQAMDHHQDAVFSSFNGKVSGPSDLGDALFPATIRDVAPGTIDLLIPLERASSCAMVVLDAERQPVALCSVTMASGDRSQGLILYGGKLDLHALDRTFSLSVTARGFVPTEVGPFVADALPPRIEVVLLRLPAFRGRVTAHGTSLANATVWLLPAPPPDIAASVEMFASRVLRNDATRGATDVGGRFELRSDRAGTFFLRAETSGLAPAMVGPLECRVGLEDVTHDLELTQGGAIEGRVLLPAGEPPESVIVGISNGDGFPMTTRVDPTGSFCFTQLTPGRFLLKQCDREIRPDAGTSGAARVPRVPEIPWNCVVEDGKTTRYDLDLTTLRACTLRGEWLDPARLPIPFFASLVPAAQAKGEPSQRAIEAEARARVTIAPDGRFDLRVGTRGDYMLFVSARLGESWLCYGEPITLAPGEQSWRREIAAGAFAGRTAPGASVTLDASRGAASFCATTKGDAQGHFAFAWVPAGLVTWRAAGETKAAEVQARFAR